MGEIKVGLAVAGKTKCKTVIIQIINKVIPSLVKAGARSGNRLFVEFDDGISGEVDLSGKVGKGVFEYWKDEMNFCKVFVSKNGSIAWNDDLEIDALNIYLKLTQQTFEEYASR